MRWQIAHMKEKTMNCYDEHEFEPSPEYRPDSAPLGGLIGAVLAAIAVMAMVAVVALWRIA